MKKWFCDKCGKEIDIAHDGFAEMCVYSWSRGGVDRMEYKPDKFHSDGNEEFMFCAECANEIFRQMDGMEKA